MGKNQIRCLQTHFVGEIAGLKQCWINVNSVLQFSCTVPLLLGLPDLPETQNSDTSLHIYCGPKSFKISVYMFFFLNAHQHKTPFQASATVCLFFFLITF